MSFTGRTLVFAFVLALLENPMAANDDDWMNLNSLRRGDKIGVIQLNRQRIEGRFQEANESAILIRADREVTISRPHVIRVYRQSGHSRTTKALIGSAIGVAAGAILNGTLGARFRNESGDFPAGASIGGAAAVGAGIGALTGSGCKTIYQRTASP
jgi:hypothetical protein